jgi:hypothetical protein
VQARARREKAAQERRAAGRRRFVERAERSQRQTAERLASALSRVGEALDERARLAEADVRRQSGSAEVAAEERRAARRAHKAAELAQKQAERWLAVAAGQTPPPA